MNPIFRSLAIVSFGVLSSRDGVSAGPAGASSGIELWARGTGATVGDDTPRDGVMKRLDPFLARGMTVRSKEPIELGVFPSLPKRDAQADRRPRWCSETERKESNHDTR